MDTNAAERSIHPKLKSAFVTPMSFPRALPLTMVKLPLVETTFRAPLQKLVAHAKKPKQTRIPGAFFTAPDKVTDPKKAAIAGGGATASIAAVRRVMHPERAALSSVTETLTGEPRRPRYRLYY